MTSVIPIIRLSETEYRATAGGEEWVIEEQQGDKPYYCFWPRAFPDDSDCADSLTEVTEKLALMGPREG